MHTTANIRQSEVAISTQGFPKEDVFFIPDDKPSAVKVSKRLVIGITFFIVIVSSAAVATVVLTSKPSCTLTQYGTDDRERRSPASEVFVARSDGQYGNHAPVVGSTARRSISTECGDLKDEEELNEYIKNQTNLWTKDIKAKVSLLYEKKSELSKSSLKTLELYKDYMKLPADDANKEAKNNLFREARTETSQLQSELHDMGVSVSKDLKLKAAAGKKLQECRRIKLGLPEPTNYCDADKFREYDSFAEDDEESVVVLHNFSDQSAQTVDTLIETHTIEEFDCAEAEDLVSQVDDFRADVSCQRKWVMHMVSEMMKEAKVVLASYNTWMKQCAGTNRNSLDAEGLAECDETQLQREQAVSKIRELQDRAYKVGKRLMDENRQAAKVLQAKQRCHISRLSVDEDVSVTYEIDRECGPLAQVSLGSILETISGTIGDSDKKVLEYLGPDAINELQNEVSKVSTKLFCMAQDLQDRVPIKKAIELLKLYQSRMKGCGGNYLEDRKLCYNQYAIDKVSNDPSLTDYRFQGARDKKDICMTGARQNRKDCVDLLTPKMQVLRSEIKEVWAQLAEDSKDIQKWIEQKASILSKFSDAVQENLLQHMARMEDLTEKRSRQRATLSIEHGEQAKSLRTRRTDIDDIDPTKIWYISLAGYDTYMEDEESFAETTILDDEYISLGGYDAYMEDEESFAETAILDDDM